MAQKKHLLRYFTMRHYVKKQNTDMATLQSQSCGDRTTFTPPSLAFSVADALIQSGLRKFIK